MRGVQLLFFQYWRWGLAHAPAATGDNNEHFGPARDTEPHHLMRTSIDDSEKLTSNPLTPPTRFSRFDSQTSSSGPFQPGSTLPTHSTSA